MESKLPGKDSDLATHSFERTEQFCRSCQIKNHCAGACGLNSWREFRCTVKQYPLSRFFVSGGSFSQQNSIASFDLQLCHSDFDAEVPGCIIKGRDFK